MAEQREQFEKWFNEYCGPSVYPTLREAWDAALAQAPRQSEQWISLSERKPRPGAWVLVVIGGFVQRVMARVDGDRWEWSDFEADSAPLDEVSHWMPIPEFPAKHAPKEPTAP